MIRLVGDDPLDLRPRQQPTDAVHRLKTAHVIEPDDDSLTRFVPFVQIDAADREVLVAYIEMLERSGARL